MNGIPQPRDWLNRIFDHTYTDLDVGERRARVGGNAWREFSRIVNYAAESEVE